VSRTTKKTSLERRRAIAVEYLLATVRYGKAAAAILALAREDAAARRRKKKGR
jgi:hypothetical protein